MYNNSYFPVETNFSSQNMDSTMKRSSLSSELSKIKKKHMNLNKIIHIYSHKAKYNIEPISKKSFSSNIYTCMNTENNDPSNSVFLTTNGNILNKIKNIKLTRASVAKREKSVAAERFNTSERINGYRSLDEKKFPVVNNLFVIPIKKERENTHKKLQELNERERMKKLINAQKLKDVNKVMKENILMMKTKAL